jgi:hypothetical protein
LLALLLLDGRQAVADPVIKVGTSTPFYYVLGSTWEAGADAKNPASSAGNDRFTPRTTGAAATTAGSGGAASGSLVGDAALAGLAASGISDSDRRGPGPFGGTGSAGNSVFVGTSGSASLLDDASALPAAASATFAYTMSPVAKAAPDAPVTAGDDGPKSDDLPLATDGDATQPATPTPAGSPPGDATPPATQEDIDTIAIRPTPTTTSGYTYAPFNRGASSLSQPTASTPRGEGATSGFAPGASVFNTSAPAAGGLANGSPIGPKNLAPNNLAPNNLASSKASISELQDEAASGLYLVTQPTDGGGGPATVTVEGHATAPADPSSFRVSAAPEGAGATSGATTVAVPIRVVGTGNGELPSSLAIFAANSTAFEGDAASFTYFLDGAATP